MILNYLNEKCQSNGPIDFMVIIIFVAGFNFFTLYLLRSLRKNVQKGYKFVVVADNVNAKKILAEHSPVVTWAEIEKVGLPSGCDAVVNVSFIDLFRPGNHLWDSKGMQKVWDTNVTSTLKLAMAMEKAEQRPKLFINMSSCDIYPQSCEEVTEYSEPGHGWLQHLYKERELAGKLPDYMKMRQVIIRQGEVFHSFENRKRGSPLQGLSSKWFPAIHLTDLVGIYQFAIENEHVKGVLNAVAPQPSRLKDLTKLNFVSRLPSSVTVLEYILFRNVINHLLNKDGCKVMPYRTQELGYNYQIKCLHHCELRKVLNSM